MTLHDPQARSPSSFAFPSPALSTSARSPARDSAHTKGAPSLGAAFQYPVRGDSLQQHGAQHVAQASTSSASTTSSSDFRSPSTARSAASSTYTSFTSDSYDHDDACDDGYSDAGSVLDSLYRDFSSARLEDSPPRFHQHTASTDSTMQLRERTRYRSSASFAPGAAPAPSSSSSAQPPHHHLEGAFGHLSLASTAAAAAPDSHMALLAALAATSSTLDRCFCGAEPEDDSIYCSRACAQADALNALCGTSSSAEDAASSSDAASLRSGSSGGSSGAGGIDSHYRRVRREEERKAKERESAQRKEDKARKARALEERERAQAQERRSTSGSLRRSEGDVGSSRASAQDSVAPPPRTSSRRTPSLSSSVSSLASSAAPSPISPAFPQYAAFPPHHASSLSSSSPFIVEPPTPSTHSFHDAPLGPVAEEELLARPCTPNPRAHHHASFGAHSPASPAHLDASDIYSSYLLTTPQAGDKLRTPTQLPHAYYSGSGSGSGSGCNSTPRAAFPHTPGGPDDVDDDSPTQRGAGATGTAGVGLRMLELCDSDDEDDDVAPLRGGHRRAAPLGGGHTKGKLSFDDVVGILSG
ncbi:hypothetical protein JCM9279_002730 [Rhodotorula babjevae]